MSFLKLDWLQPGMELQAPVMDDQGTVLLAAGMTLTDSHIALLRGRGIPGADVRSPEAETVTEPAVDENATLEQAHERFRHVDTKHPLIAELWRLYLQTYTPQG